MALTSGQIEKMRRDEANRIVVSNPKECHYCKNSIALDATKCGICSFPQKGTQEEMRRFVWDKRHEKRRVKEAQEAYIKRINKAKWISIALAVIFFIGFVVESDFFKLFDPIVYGIYAIFISTFLLCGIFMLKFPRICASISLGLYVSWILFQAINSPQDLHHGALFKVIFTAGLIYGVKEAFTHKPPSLKTPDLNILDEEFLSD